MNPIGVFELQSGKVIISRFEVGIDQDENGEIRRTAFHMEKPMLLMAGRDQQGRSVMNLSELPGMFPQCVIYDTAVAGHNFDAVPAQLRDAYIQVTTGLSLASSMPPGRPPIV